MFSHLLAGASKMEFDHAIPNTLKIYLKLIIIKNFQISYPDKIKWVVTVAVAVV